MKTKTFFTICLMLLGAMALQAQELKPFKADNWKWGLKDQNGKEVISPKYDGISELNEGFFKARIGRDFAMKYALINKKGEEISPFKYYRMDNFSDGLALVYALPDNAMGRMGLGSTAGYIDMSGKEVIPLKYNDAYGFSEGLAAVYLNNKYGFIDKTGEEVISVQYESIGNEDYPLTTKYFKNGRIEVRKDGRTFFIDKTGKEIK